jgi:DNA-binding response OmpR family regulator
MIRKIYVADDEKSIRELMFRFLTNEGFVVKAFPNGDELMDSFKKSPADLVILDVMMPGTDGFGLSTQLRKISNVPIIIVSARDSEIDRITGIALGSDDYLTKPFSPMELVARVKAIFRRIEFDNQNDEQKPIVYTYANIRIEVFSRDVWVGSQKIELTPTEFSLMVYLIKNHTKALSRDELLRDVWKYDFDTDTRAADDVIKRLRKKLSAAGAEVRIEAVWGFGFRFVEAPPASSDSTS